MKSKQFEKVVDYDKETILWFWYLLSLGVFLELILITIITSTFIDIRILSISFIIINSLTFIAWFLIGRIVRYEEVEE